MDYCAPVSAGGRWRTVAVAAGLALVACTSEAEPGATAASASPSPSAAAVDASTACELFTQRDAEELFGGPVERVADPVEQGLVTAAAVPAGTDVCYYRPTPDDGSRFAAVAVLPPGSITEEEYLAQGERGVAIGGPGDDGFEVDGSIITRVGDTVVLAVATTIADEANDRAAGLEIASLVVSRLPPPTPDPDNPSCQLLTEALAEPILGVDLVYGGDEISDVQHSGCGFHAVDGPTNVTLRLTRGPDAAAEYEAIRADAADNEGFRSVPGIGDDAFATTSEAFVLAGDTALRITVFAPEGDEAAVAVEIARAIVTEL